MHVADCLKKSQQKGFTLMELLVVLVLISLLMTTLMQGLSFFLKLKQRGSALVLTQQKTQMQEYWFKTLIQGLTPYQSFTEKHFEGSKTELTGQTMTTLTSAPASIGEINLKLEQTKTTVKLIYTAGEQVWILGEWLSNKAFLSYQDQQGSQYASWPPKNISDEELMQLPSLIMLHITTPRGNINWFVSIAGRLNPKVVLEDMF
jgi:prepilin-type N-terminal cleavage/methylation domain-containing protein